MKQRRVTLLIVFLAAIHLTVLAAGWIAPYGYAEQNRDFPYAPPAHIHRAGLRLFVFGLTATYAEERSQTYPIHLFRNGHLFGVDAPGLLFLAGTDGYGRDVFSRILYGAQVSMLTGVLAAILSLGIGWTLGTAAGFFGGWTDRLLMRGSEFFMALPWLYLLLAVRAFLPLHIGSLETFILLVGIIGGLGWVRPARLIRGVVLSAREQGYVLAARGFGAGPIYLIRRHVLPQTRGVVLAQATVLIPLYILAEVTLSFLGLGVGEPVPSWGNMLAEARQYHALIEHPWMLAPGGAAIPVLLAYVILADVLGASGNEPSKEA